MPVTLGGVDHGVGVGDVAVGDHPGQIVAGDRQHEGIGAGRQQQAIIAFLGAVVGDHPAFDAVDAVHRLAQMQADAVVGVPLVIVENDVLDGHLASEHRREQDAVVVGVRLGAEYGDLVLVGGDFQQLLERAYARHAVADHHQFLLAHFQGSIRCILMEPSKQVACQS